MCSHAPRQKRMGQTGSSSSEALVAQRYHLQKVKLGRGCSINVGSQFLSPKRCHGRRHGLSQGHIDRKKTSIIRFIHEPFDSCANLGIRPLDVRPEAVRLVRGQFDSSAAIGWVCLRSIHSSKSPRSRSSTFQLHTARSRLYQHKI